jgi:DNA-binding IclR family transcriptional regulator
MSDTQARIVDLLRAEQIAMTATEIAQRIAMPRPATLDMLRDLEDAGQVCGAESGFYRVAGVLRKNRVRA